MARAVRRPRPRCVRSSSASGRPETGIVELVPPRAPDGAPAYGVARASSCSPSSPTSTRSCRAWRSSASAASPGSPLGPDRLAVVHDPNGVRVELMDTVARSNLADDGGGRAPHAERERGGRRTGRWHHRRRARVGSAWPSGWCSRGGATSSSSRRPDGVGGTWRVNTYPGAACDVPSHLYSYSFALKPDWTKTYANQPEILQYFEECADRYGIRPHLRTAHPDHVGARGTRRRVAGDLVRRRGRRYSCRRGGERHRDVHHAVVPRHRRSRRTSPGRVSTRRAGSTSTTWRASGSPSSEPGRARRRSCPRWPRSPRRSTSTSGRRSGSCPARTSRSATRTSSASRTQPRGHGEAPRRDLLGLREHHCLPRTSDADRRRAARHWRSATSTTGSRTRTLKAKLTPDYPFGCKRTLVCSDFYKAVLRDNVELVTERDRPRHAAAAS